MYRYARYARYTLDNRGVHVRVRVDLFAQLYPYNSAMCTRYTLNNRGVRVRVHVDRFAQLHP